MAKCPKKPISHFPHIWRNNQEENSLSQLAALNGSPMKWASVMLETLRPVGYHIHNGPDYVGKVKGCE